MKLITIQISNGKSWDETPVTIHEVENCGEVAQAIAQATGQQVRMTYYFGDGSNATDPIYVCRCNGHYFNPKAIQRFKTNPEINKIV